MLKINNIQSRMYERDEEKPNLFVENVTQDTRDTIKNEEWKKNSTAKIFWVNRSRNNVGEFKNGTINNMYCLLLFFHSTNMQYSWYSKYWRI